MIGQLLETIVVTHSLHATLVHFPIALSLTGFIFLLLALKERSNALERAAFYCMVITAVSSVLASFSGYRSVLVRFDGDAPLVPQKAFLGVTLILLAGYLAFSRARNDQLLWNPKTMVMYVSGFAGTVALTATLTYLGGVILYGF